MIQHIVMWKLLDEANGKSRDENFERMREGLSALPAIIPEIKSLSLLKNENPAAKGNMDAVLVTAFENLADLAVYANHPEHLKVGAFIVGVVSARSAIDYVI